MVASVFFIAPLAVHASLYLPGATLNPDCAPTDSALTCGISTTVASSTANSIPYYAANGSVLSATSTMTILSNGNIGIGTTTPFARFSIAGIAGGSANLFAISTSTSAFATTTALTINQNGDISLGNGANLSVGGNLTVTGTTNLSQPLGIASGGTGAATAATARTALGLPFVSYSTQNNWYNFSAWGDSLTNGAGGDGTTYPAVLQSLFGNRQVYNNNIVGGTSSQILTRFQSSFATHEGDFTIIWSGRNNYNDAVQVKADIATMVAALPSPKRFLVLSILNGDYASEYSGQSGYNQIIALNNDLAATYPNNYLDVRSYLVSLYNPAIPQDVTDHTNDIPPSSLRYDNIHLVAAGYTDVANYVYNWIVANDTSLGNTVTNLADILTIFSSPPPIGTVTPSVGNFTNLNTTGVGTFASLNTTGKVGIGTTSPSQLLEVTGGMNSSPTIRISSTNSTAGPIGSLSFYENYYVNQEQAKISVLRDASNVNGALAFSVNSDGFSLSERMRIDKNGKVGIGTTTIPNTLTVEGTGIRVNSYAINSNGGVIGLGTGGSNNRATFTMGTPTVPAEFKILQNGIWTLGSVVNSALGFITNNIERVRIDTAGNVGIGTTTPFAKLSIHANAGETNKTLFAIGSSTSTYATTTLFSVANTGDVTINGSSGGTCTIGNGIAGTSCSSDERLKTNIALIVDPLQNIEQLRGVTFNWADPNKSQTQFIGVIAQDVQKVFPQAVSTVGGYLAVDYGALVAPLIEAVKEIGSISGEFKSNLIAWLGNAENGINDFYANTTHQNTLCVGDTCVTESQLKTILQNSGQTSSSPPAAGGDATDSVLDSATSTDSTDTTATTTDSVVDDSTASDNTATSSDSTSSPQADSSN